MHVSERIFYWKKEILLKFISQLSYVSHCDSEWCHQITLFLPGRYPTLLKPGRPARRNFWATSRFHKFSRSTRIWRRGQIYGRAIRYWLLWVIIVCTQQKYSFLPIMWPPNHMIHYTGDLWTGGYLNSFNSNRPSTKLGIHTTGVV